MEKVAAKILCLNNLEPAQYVFPKSTILKGIYLWGYKNDIDQIIPLYVGKSKNIYERIIQHYCRFRGGEYCIPLELYKTEQSNQNTIVVNHNIFEPTDLSMVYSLFQTENMYTANLRYILLNFRFFYLELEEKDDRIKAEKYLGQQIGTERLISSISSLNSSIDFVLSKKIDAEFNKYYKNS